MKKFVSLASKELFELQLQQNSTSNKYAYNLIQFAIDNINSLLQSEFKHKKLSEMRSDVAQLKQFLNEECYKTTSLSNSERAELFELLNLNHLSAL